MNLNNEFPSKWLKGDDLGDNPVTVTIAKVGIEEFDNPKTGQKDRKVSLHFRGKEKGLICNVGMRNIIVGFYGPETDTWIGKSIKIMAVPFTNDKGETSMVCRIHPKLPTQAPASPAAAPLVDPADQDGGNTDDPDF